MSEFGKGLTYCLGMFLAHGSVHEAEYNQKLYEKSGIEWIESHYVALWFNGASDHLYDIVIEFAPVHLRERLKKFVDRCLDIGHGVYLMSDREKELGLKDKVWAVQEAIDLLFEIDKANGVPVEKGDFE
jgi:hypothetical protein